MTDEKDMKFWVFAFNPLERYMVDPKRVFDAWEDAGVRGLVVGRMFFMGDDGEMIPAYRQNPAAYRRFGQEAPEPEAFDADKERALARMFDDVKARGWPLFIFGGGGPAQVQSLIDRYPQVDGVIIDGPGENHYELAKHHGGELLELRPHEVTQFGELGLDVDRLQRGIGKLRESFRLLTPDRVRYHAGGGTLGSMLLFDLDEDGLYWLRARQERSVCMWRDQRADLDKVDRHVQMGGIPRITTWSSLTGQNYHRMPEFFDFIYPKHYYWHRGFDGMYGTVQRWVMKFREWNPSLTEEDGFALMKSLFGLDLPGVNSLYDLEMGFPEEFYTQVVQGETRRALAATGDPERTIFWVSTGRYPHAGDPMPAYDLEGILQATKDAGGTRVLYHPDPDPGPSEWTVLSNLCGKPWTQSRDGYWPPDSHVPDEWNQKPY